MNSIGMLLQAVKNPQAFVQQAMNSSQFASNPMAKNALEMYQKGDKQGLNELADNLCREKGINRSDFERQIRSQIGM